jgi:hypothetical protein
VTSAAMATAGRTAAQRGQCVAEDLRPLHRAADSKSKSILRTAERFVECTGSNLLSTVVTVYTS